MLWSQICAFIPNIHHSFWGGLNMNAGQWLVGGWATPLKNMSSSVGMMTFPIYGKIRVLFQTTHQMTSSIYPVFCSIASRWVHHWRHGLYEILWIEAPTGWNHPTERNPKGTNEWSKIIAPQVPTVGPYFQVSVTKRKTITWPMIFVWNPPSSPSLLKSLGLPFFFPSFHRVNSSTRN